MCGGLDQGDSELLSSLYPKMKYVLCSSVRCIALSSQAACFLRLSFCMTQDFNLDEVV